MWIGFAIGVLSTLAVEVSVFVFALWFTARWDQVDDNQAL